MSEPLLSRSGTSCPFGKLRTEVKTKVDDDTADMVAKEARNAGMTVSEWLRDLVLLRVRGEDYLRSVYERRVAAVLGKGPERGAE